MEAIRDGRDRPRADPGHCSASTWSRWTKAGRRSRCVPGEQHLQPRRHRARRAGRDPARQRHGLRGPHHAARGRRLRHARDEGEPGAGDHGRHRRGCAARATVVAPRLAGGHRRGAGWCGAERRQAAGSRHLHLPDHPGRALASVRAVAQAAAPTSSSSGPAYVATVSFVASRAVPFGGFFVALPGGMALARVAQLRGLRQGFGASLATLIETVALMGPARFGVPFTQALSAPVLGRDGGALGRDGVADPGLPGHPAVPERPGGAVLHLHHRRRAGRLRREREQRRPSWWAWTWARRTPCCSPSPASSPGACSPRPCRSPSTAAA